MTVCYLIRLHWTKGSNSSLTVINNSFKLNCLRDHRSNESQNITQIEKLDLIDQKVTAEVSDLKEPFWGHGDYTINIYQFSVL